MLFHRFISVSWVAGRWLALAAVLSLMASAGVRAQAPGTGVHLESPPAASATSTHIFLDESSHQGPFPVFYVDGQRLDSTSIVKIGPGNIQDISVLLSDKAYIARLLGPDEGERGVVFITTKAGQHTRAVRAFNRRLVRLGRRQP